MHWADHTAQRLSEKYGSQVIASGITPSGEFHIGHLREILTAEMIHRACLDAGEKSEYIFIVDSMDPLRRVYDFLSDDYEKFIGCPLAYIPSPNPDGTPDYEGESYAMHFLNPFLDALKQIGVNPVVVMNHETYDKGLFAEKIDIAGLERRLKSTIADTIEFALQEGKRKISLYLESSDVDLPNDIFSSEYPCVVNRDALELIDDALENAIKSERSQGEISIANSTVNIMKKSRKAISKFIEIDMWLGIGQWAISNRCTIPEISLDNPGVWMKDGRHLLLGCESDPVTYGLGEVSPEGERERIALLSGANSGGKTTLLETLASMILLSHSGLPVPACNAKIGLLDELHILAKVSGTQSAGALERTLNKLAEVLVSSERKIILADELEAITEPGAASLILGGLLKSSKSNPDTNILLVTHIGNSISEVMGGDIRIDGIEAQGLDENMDLIVDRNPKRNHLARSTPELIVRRLASRTEGPTSEIFTSLLQGF